MISTIENLRNQLFARALEENAPKFRSGDHTSVQKAHAIANHMPFYFGYFKNIDDPECPEKDREFFQKTMDEEAEKLGFTTSQDFKKALEELREQLKSELLKEKWLAYFG